jgi:hypothetical protein
MYLIGDILKEMLGIGDSLLLMQFKIHYLKVHRILKD